MPLQLKGESGCFGCRIRNLMMKSLEFFSLAIATCSLLSACIIMPPSVVPSQTPPPTSLTNTGPIRKDGNSQVKADVSTTPVRSSGIISRTIEVTVTPPVTPSQTLPPTSLTSSSSIHKVGDFQVKVDVSNTTVRSNEIITFTIEITGTTCGNPTYFIDIRDRTSSQSKYRATVLPSGEITHEYGESQVLELSSVSTVNYQPVAIILKAQNAGVAEIAVAVNGEIGYTDGKDNSWFNYETRFSEPFTVTVSEK